MMTVAISGDFLRAKRINTGRRFRCVLLQNDMIAYVLQSTILPANVHTLWHRSMGHSKALRPTTIREASARIFPTVAL
jgi:hypothetical protein